MEAGEVVVRAVLPVSRVVRETAADRVVRREANSVVGLVVAGEASSAVRGWEADVEVDLEAKGGRVEGAVVGGCQAEEG